LNTDSANPVYLGIIYGPNGQKTYVTNGPATQLVNEIITCGSGNAWDTYDTSGDIASEQSNILACASQVGNQPFFFTGTYTIDGISGTNSVTFNPVVTNAPPATSVLPTLSILLTDPPATPTVLDTVVVSWPSTGPGVVLQTNSDLTTANWGDYTGPVTSSNGINSVSLYKPTGSLFFRLKH
jgi:hypothetical protein